MTNNSNLMLFGLPRSGTNYVEALLHENFHGVKFLNEHYPEALPTHKHFRLYDEKHLVPGPQYLNQFFYPDFSSFHTHVSALTENENLQYLVTVRNPYAWYVSYSHWAHKRPFWKRQVIKFLRKEANAHFLLEWNLFMKKWIQFASEAPDRVKIVRHEDLLQRFDQNMAELEAFFHLKPKSEKWHNPQKVGMSDAFSASKKTQLASGKYIKEIPELHFRAITEVMDKAVMDTLGYEWLPSHPTYHLQRHYKHKDDRHGQAD